MPYFNANDPKHRDGVRHATVKPSKRMPVRPDQHKFDPKQGVPKPEAPKQPKTEPKFGEAKPKREVMKPFPIAGNEDRDYRGEKNGQRV